jgi:hypothetical protein
LFKKSSASSMCPAQPRRSIMQLRCSTIGPVVFGHMMRIPESFVN